ncbi:hypothetical protein QQF64_006383 [Cirrhinus molitorella]|uniref:Uncharacterized protein n=1 Tax=Cirrhinus molitorella TaxID=172907 RepID=A0ABR3MEW1_9TELE
MITVASSVFSFCSEYHLHRDIRYNKKPAYYLIMMIIALWWLYAAGGASVSAGPSGSWLIQANIWQFFPPVVQKNTSE